MSDTVESFTLSPFDDGPDRPVHGDEFTNMFGEETAVREYGETAVEETSAQPTDETNGCRSGGTKNIRRRLCPG